MDSVLKELTKLEQLTSWSTHPNTSSSSSKGKSPSIQHSLDTLLSTLRTARAQLDSDPSHAGPSLASLPAAVETCKKEVDYRQKEVYNSLAKIGKALDKVFPAPMPDLSDYAPLFGTHVERRALQEGIAWYYLRNGNVEVARVLAEEAGFETALDESRYAELNQVLAALKQGDIDPAQQWVDMNHSFLQARNSTLSFSLTKAHYLHLLLTQPSPLPALTFARNRFSSFQPTHTTEIQRLLGALAYLPATRLASSPYADILADVSRNALAKEFTVQWCALKNLPRESPLQVAVDLGPAALARIEKGKKILRARRPSMSAPAAARIGGGVGMETGSGKGGESTWLARDELPIEIPLPDEHRYHSVFTCPVSKEQSSERNPPMMMLCGHVVCHESLERLAKQNQHLKCPYCPVDSKLEQAIRVHF